MLFVQKEEEQEFQQALQDRMQSVDVNFANACKVELLDSPLEFEFHNNEKCSPGSCVSFTDSSDQKLYSTVGAFLRDDKDKLYFLSTIHGNEFKKCHILNSIECKSVAEVYHVSPLLDACLIEVPEPEGKTKCSAAIPIPHMEPGLCGPYAGPTEELATKYETGEAASSDGKHTVVRKFGTTTGLTTGVLVYSHFTLPERGITDALMIEPRSDIFTVGGDSGSVIFRHYPCRSPHTDMALCYEALAFTCGGVSNPKGYRTIATRLDDIIKHFEKELDTKLYLLGTHQCGLAEGLSKLQL